jgi:hypothetical protein
MRRSFGLASTVAITISTLLAVLVPGVASASPSDPTIYPINCASAHNVYVYLDYGINSVTITNTNGCSGTNNTYLDQGGGATWTYSQVIAGVTTSGAYDPANTLRISTIGSTDSFTITSTSVSDVYVRFSTTARTFYIFFNKQIDTLSPDPVVIGEQVTVTGNNLSSLTSLVIYLGMDNFTVTTADRTDTQLTFIVPLTRLRFGSTVSVSPGTYELMSHSGKTLTLTAAPTTTAPDAPTIGTAIAVSPTSASIAFIAPTSDGGETIETYTATSSPGSITGQVVQPGSGTITMTGLTSSTAYTFSVTASNSVGTSSASSSSISLTTPASAEELAAQNAAAVVEAAAVAKAAADTALLVREAEKRSARDVISSDFKSYADTKIEIFSDAEIKGITSANIAAVHEEIAALPEHSTGDITGILKIAHKYEVVGIIASERVKTIYSNSLIEIGLIPEESKYKATLTRVVKGLSQDERSSYAAIKVAIDAEMAEIQARKDQLTAVLTRIAARRAG